MVPAGGGDRGPPAGPGAGQAFAAKRLTPDDRAHHITVNVQAADMGGTGDLRNGFINTGMCSRPRS